MVNTKAGIHVMCTGGEAPELSNAQPGMSLCCPVLPLRRQVFACHRMSAASVLSSAKCFANKICGVASRAGMKRTLRGRWSPQASHSCSAALSDLADNCMPTAPPRLQQLLCCFELLSLPGTHLSTLADWYCLTMRSQMTSPWNHENVALVPT